MSNLFSSVLNSQSSSRPFVVSPYGDKNNSSAFSAFSSAGNDLFASMQQMIMLNLVLQLLQQIANPGADGEAQHHSDTDLGVNNQGTLPTPVPVSPESQPTTPIALSEHQQQVLYSSFARDADGVLLEGHTVNVLDKGAVSEGQPGVGDIVQVLNPQGEVVGSSALQGGDVYDIEFRVNQLKNAEAIGSGWEFSEKLVEIKGGELEQPEARFYTRSNGGFGIENVLERNDFWEVVERDSARYLVMRTQDDAGNPVKASDAINAVFDHRDDYAFDCASPIPLLNLKSTLDTIGEDDFNHNAGQLQVSGWFDAYDASSGDGGYISTVRHAEAGAITVAGASNLDGETALFDNAQGDQLVAGGVYYFDLPGDTTSSFQGWNAIYLGQNDTGEHRFWSNSIGEVTASFKNGSWEASGGLEKYYLGAAVSDPNVNRLENWDSDRSVLA
ncbi:MAG: hypothetical protein ACPG51_10110 [Thiolinea sp.]